MKNKKSEWEDSYSKKQNFLFYPHEEVIRFFSKYYSKRTDIKHLESGSSVIGSDRVLDIGCGIGRHVVFCNDLGLEAYGVDLSEIAINTLVEWGSLRGISDIAARVVAGDARNIPWPSSHFKYAISHGVLDSMSYDIDRETCIELARVMSEQGLFYCDLISGDDSNHASGFSGEERVKGDHESGTIQLYFNPRLIDSLFEGLFEIVDCYHIRRENMIEKSHTSRYHLAVRRI